MLTTFTVTLPDQDAKALLALAATHPALRPHAVHLAAVRYGLRAFEANPDLLTSGLREIAEERLAARRGEVSP